MKTPRNIEFNFSINHISKFCFVSLIFAFMFSCTEKNSSKSESTIKSEFAIDTLAEKIKSIEKDKLEREGILADINESIEIEELDSLEGDFENMSQTEINLSQQDIYVRQRALLDKTINAIKKEYQENNSLIENLEKSQEVWLHYSDAQILVKYPKDDYIHETSVYNLCYFIYLTELTNQRIKTLETWLVGERQGQVCGGSVKLKD